MSGKLLKTIIAVLVFFFSYNVEAVSPAQPILPSDNIQDPGSPSTPWGGCGPADANCYVTTTNNPDFSENVAGLEYATSTGILSLTSGYVIPTAASVAGWNDLLASSTDNILRGGNSFGTSLAIGTNDANSLSLKTNNLNRFTIASNGNIVINSGTLSGPGWTIDQVGNFTGTSTLAGAIMGMSNSNFGGYDISNVGLLSATTLTLTNGLSVASGGTGASSFAAGRILFGNGTSAINSTSTLFWDNANGRLGIGTTSPSSRLDVWGNFSISTTTTTALFVNQANARTGINTVSPEFSLDVRSLTGSLVYPIRVQNVAAGTTGILFTSDAQTGQSRGKGAIAFTSNNSWGRGNLYLLNNNSADITNPTLADIALTVTAAREIGIGTTTPNAKLFVTGTAGTQDIFAIASSSNARLLTVTSVGNVGIGTADPQYTLHVNGTAGKIGGGTWTDSSDERLKTALTPISGNDALEKILKINPVLFDWINPGVHGGVAASGGFTAQNILEVFPDFVTMNKCQGADCALTGGSDTYSLTLPFKFFGYIVSAVKEIAQVQGMFKENLITWMGGASNGIKKLFADEVRTDKLCVGETCVTEAQLIDLLSKSTYAPSGNVQPAPTPVTPEPTPEVTPDVVSEPLVDESAPVEEPVTPVETETAE